MINLNELKVGDELKTMYYSPTKGYVTQVRKVTASKEKYFWIDRDMFNREGRCMSHLFVIRILND